MPRYELELPFKLPAFSLPERGGEKQLTDTLTLEPNAFPFLFNLKPQDCFTALLGLSINELPLQTSDSWLIVGVFGLGFVFWFSLVIKYQCAPM